MKSPRMILSSAISGLKQRVGQVQQTSLLSEMKPILGCVTLLLQYAVCYGFLPLGLNLTIIGKVKNPNLHQEWCDIVRGLGPLLTWAIPLVPMHHQARLYHSHAPSTTSTEMLIGNLLHRNIPIHSLHSLSNHPLARLLSQLLALLKTLPDREDAVDDHGIDAFFDL
jgi:hypothetical protein